MQGQARGGSVLSRSKQYQEYFRQNGCARARPFALMSRVIGEGPTNKIDRRGRRIVKLDPIRILLVLVGQRMFVIRHELTDDNLRGRGEAKQEEQQNHTGNEL